MHGKLASERRLADTARSDQCNTAMIPQDFLNEEDEALSEKLLVFL